MSTFSQRIKEILFKEGLTIKAFCEKIGLKSPNTIQLIIRENRTPSPKTMKRILDAFPKMDTDWFIYGNKELKESDNILTNDSLTVTAQQIYCKLDEDSAMYKDMLSNKLRDDRNYYDNDSRHSKDIRRIFEGFQTLESKVEHYAVQASSSVIEKITNAMEQQTKLQDMLIDGLTKIKHLETDLEDIKTFMAANFELDKMNKKKSKQINKLIPR